MRLLHRRDAYKWASFERLFHIGGSKICYLASTSNGIHLIYPVRQERRDKLVRFIAFYWVSAPSCCDLSPTLRRNPSSTGHYRCVSLCDCIRFTKPLS